jgi:hypothetical protein
MTSVPLVPTVTSGHAGCLIPRKKVADRHMDVPISCSSLTLEREEHLERRHFCFDSELFLVLRQIRCRSSKAIQRSLDPRACDVASPILGGKIYHCYQLFF